MDIDRPHFRTPTTAATTSEFFICFTSRLSSSSSMKLSKSILSPGRAARDGGPVSLSSSLSRRLRTNGSLKGGQASPFFTTTGKKRGCAFENPEPSSPKVTCIGQVRVKTKKKVKQSRSLSKRRTGGGEVSFRKIDQTCGDGDDKVFGQQQQQRYSNASAHYQPPQECLPQRNQRWVHLPISICEALRTFGSEFSCLFPCRSSCSSTGEREKSEKQNGDENGCGSVFARWLVSVNDGEGGKRREIELVVGGGDEEEEREESVSMRTSRRHVFEDIEVKDDRIELKGQSLEREEEAARVSICIPPKNALLLMRCGSDPMKMAALANRFSWDAAAKNEKEYIIIEEEEEEKEEYVVDGKDEVFEQEVAVFGETNVEKEVEYKLETEGGEEIEEEEFEISIEETLEEKTKELEKIVVEDEEEGGGCGGGEEEEVESNMSSFEALLEQENEEHYEECCPIQDEEEVEEDTQLVCHASPSTDSDEEEDGLRLQCNEESAAAAMKAAQGSSIELKVSALPNEEENQATETIADEDVEEQEEQPATAAKSEKNQQTQEFVEEKKFEKEGPLLPECLLLMMCEPKLSMEVSKETWVCSTDFMPERPRRVVKPAKPIIEKNELQQPPRSSCSLPAAASAASASMASMIEQKLVNAAAYEPFVLTRCKSEPMRTAAAKLMPESCFWKNAVRKLEPHTMGVGAAGVGF